MDVEIYKKNTKVPVQKLPTVLKKLEKHKFTIIKIFCHVDDDSLYIIEAKKITVKK